MTIKNKWYRQFLDEDLITLLTPEQIEQALENVTNKHKTEGRALICVAYLTGARPVEYLELKAKDVTKDKSFILVKMPGKKGGRSRTIHLQSKNKFAAEFYKYSLSIFPEASLFHNYRCHYTRTKTHQTKKGELKKYNFTSTADKLKYYFKIWFSHIDEGISPYYLRHNRFSSLAANDVDNQSIKRLKGAKTMQSVEKYLHMSSKSSKALAKKIV